MTVELRNEIENHKDYKNFVSKLEEHNHKPIMLALGGSYAYGTNVEDSDIDLRGCYLNNKSEIFGITKDKETYVMNNDLDISVYSLKKAAWLMKGCNPAFLEILGCRDEDYLFITDIGNKLRDNAHLFLSKRATKTFGGYAASQLNRLVNRSGRAKDNLLDNEKRSFERSFSNLITRYKPYLSPDACIKHEGEDLLLSFSIEGMPVNQLPRLLNEFDSIDKSYRKSTRNEKAHKRGKLSKHMMHLIRLYMMGIQLMRDQVIQTYRYGSEHDLLMSIRNGDYLESDGATPTTKFNNLVKQYQQEYIKACDETLLPESPDEDKINDLLIEIFETM